MIVENKQAIEEFARKHPFSKNSFKEWIEKVESAQWQNMIEMKQTFNSVDYRRPIFIYNIGGNKYRLIAEVNFELSVVQIVRIGTHDEYSGWKL